MSVNEALRFLDVGTGVMLYPSVLPHAADNHFGYFPGLAALKVEHGFQWSPLEGQDSLNIVAGRENTANPNAYSNVVQRVVTGLERLELGSPPEAIMLAGGPDNTDITYIMTRHDLRRSRLTPRGILVDAGAVFCVSGIGMPVFAPGLDCVQAIVIASGPELPTLYGIVHTGRAGVVKSFPFNAVQSLVKRGYSSAEIRVAMPPSLEPMAHVLQPSDVPKLLGNIALWDREIYWSGDTGLVHVDVASQVAKQYMAAGVPPQNIEMYTVGTYKSASQGMGGSYRHSRTTGNNCAGFLIAVRIRN